MQSAALPGLPSGKDMMDTCSAMTAMQIKRSAGHGAWGMGHGAVEEREEIESIRYTGGLCRGQCRHQLDGQHAIPQWVVCAAACV